MAGKIGKPDGNTTFAKNPRVLHIGARSIEGEESFVELRMHLRSAIEKGEFCQQAKAWTHALSEPERVVFRQWLAGRYVRSAFPNAFEDRLDGKLRDRIDKLLGKSGKEIRGLYFDLDDGEMLERPPDECYALEIWVVYNDEIEDESAAEALAAELATIFKDFYFAEATEAWSGIELLDCHAVSSWNFPLALANSTKPWRLDHRSYKALPDATFPEPAR